MIVQTRRKRLTTNEISEIVILYEELGWRILWIAKKFEIDHTSILYLIRKKQLVRKSPIQLMRPKEVQQLYIPKKIDDTDIVEQSSQVSSYADILKEIASKKKNTIDSECSHQFWIKRCSLCHAILDSDSRHIAEPIEGPAKLIYNEFDKYVCSYETAIRLQELQIKQRSLLYWLYYEDTDVLSIRLNKNLPDKNIENILIASAFTSQELIKLLNKYNGSCENNKLLKKIMWYGDNPEYLGKLLCRLIRQKKINEYHSRKKKIKKI